MILVLLPGLDGTGILFGPFIKALDSRYPVQVIRYPTSEPLGYSELEAVVRDELPVDGPFVILGESFSGPLAISIAASCSSRLKGLILVSSFARNPRPFFSGFGTLAGMLPLEKAPHALRLFFLLGPYATPELRTTLAQAIGQVSPAAIRARLKAMLTIDVSEELSALTMPVLYLRAADDRLVPPAASELVKRLQPRTRVVQIEAPHLLLQAAPVAAAQVVSNFLKNLGNTL